MGSTPCSSRVAAWDVVLTIHLGKIRVAADTPVSDCYVIIYDVGRGRSGGVRLQHHRGL